MQIATMGQRLTARAMKKHCFSLGTTPLPDTQMCKSPSAYGMEESNRPVWKRLARTLEDPS